MPQIYRSGDFNVAGAPQIVHEVAKFSGPIQQLDVTRFRAFELEVAGDVRVEFAGEILPRRAVRFDVLAHGQGSIEFPSSVLWAAPLPAFVSPAVYSFVSFGPGAWYGAQWGRAFS